MCGIVGAVTRREVVGILLEGLQRLEYRGYDSAGLCVIADDHDALTRVRRVGKVSELSGACAPASVVRGKIGIAHTRWATHGKPTEANAHPHVSSRKVAVVHNGIIENHDSLRYALGEDGYQFTSETDTEVIAHLLHREIEACGDFMGGVSKAIGQLEGAYAIAVLHLDHPDRIIGARAGSPLVLGLGIGENFIASDPQALRPVTDRFIFLKEGEVVELTTASVAIFDGAGEPVEGRIEKLEDQHDATDKGPFRHYMAKEIFEQPDTVAATLEGRISSHHVLEQAFGVDAAAIFARVRAIQIVACGSSYYTGMVARYWFEQLAGIPCQVEVASEQRYRTVAVLPGTLLVTISQSGETADTLAAQRAATDPNYLASLCLCNVPNSSLVRESDLSLMIRAGTEICVASTKAFTNQLTDLLMLVIAIGHHHGLARETEAEVVAALSSLPHLLRETLKLDAQIQEMAARFVEKHHVLFLGRGTHYPIALEGALKLKEISYIHAEGYPAGELKHGPLALVDEQMPVVAVAPGDLLLEKLKSNLQEVKARGGELFVIADRIFADADAAHVLEMPGCPAVVSPMLYTIPMQLLAYHVAVLKGTDVDQPRNLAKSVTVE
ncbi:MAG: glutamine--fructose-6-phosphate transaminase (isomerizing) [Proteobacteria bacterium]|nr:glutamine--fructose-6-phosphate transaminase (isomerizing) [Pseudomonadota bacterium]MDA1299957.1 glutamine--fructose-6-phosphate transaminase (isomerizing) [Pseudomonadota bacterium]